MVYIDRRGGSAQTHHRLVRGDTGDERLYMILIVSNGDRLYKGSSCYSNSSAGGVV